MLLIRKPSVSAIRRFLESQSKLEFNYKPVGCTRHEPPPGYDVDHTRIRLGEGEKTFLKAKAALERWQQFQLAWTEPCWPDTPIAEGQSVAILVHLLGFWSLNACRIIYIVNEQGPTIKVGFAYGTLPAHSESGEERFLVEWDRNGGTVWFEILAFSRPNGMLARLGYFYARQKQKQFREDAAKAMLMAII